MPIVIEIVHSRMTWKLIFRVEKINLTFSPFQAVMVLRRTWMILAECVLSTGLLCQRRLAGWTGGSVTDLVVPLGAESLAVTRSIRSKSWIVRVCGFPFLAAIRLSAAIASPSRPTESRYCVDSGSLKTSIRIRANASETSPSVINV